MMRGLRQRKSANLLQQDIVSPKGCYVYAIYVDGVLRYIGKGTNGRVYDHMKEVRQRLTRRFKLKNVSPIFQQKLTEAVIKGAVIEEIVIADNLTSKQAYELEHCRMEKMVHDGKRTELWNVVPPSIYTPQEYEAFVKKLLKNLRSKNHLARYFARMQLARLAAEAPWPAAGLVSATSTAQSRHLEIPAHHDGFSDCVRSLAGRSQFCI